MLVHAGEKPYVCPVDGCNKAFTAGSSLNVHMCKHTGEKPFKCDINGCAKTYTTAATLRAHQKRHGMKAVVVDFNDASQGDMPAE
ncbi:Transcription factorIIIA [Porites harrisoni]